MKLFQGIKALLAAALVSVAMASSAVAGAVPPGPSKPQSVDCMSDASILSCLRCDSAAVGGGYHYTWSVRSLNPQGQNFWTANTGQIMKCTMKSDKKLKDDCRRASQVQSCALSAAEKLWGL